MSEILYRKWRPQTFAELAGQEHVATTLTNALASDRPAHAYLFSGPRGTGKTSTGRLLAKALNCTDRQGGEPCNRCESCLAFLAGRSLDMIELDAASNRGIDEIRSLRDKVAFAPSGQYKVYLIDEVHMLTDAAFNALLKTLEEPPPHVVFILATTEAHRLPATIASRCQRFDFRRIPLAAAVQTLQRICDGEGIVCEPAALELIARSSTGSLRDAENLLDQMATSYGHDISLEQIRAGLGLIGDERAGRLARLALAGDLGGGLSLIASVRDDGLDLRQFQRELVDELRDLLMVKSGLAPQESTPERRQEMQGAVDGVSMQTLLTALRAFGEADLKPDPSSTLPLDIALADCVLGESGNRAGGQAGREAVAAPPSVRSAPAERPVMARSPTPPSVRAVTPPAASTPAPERRPEPVEAAPVESNGTPSSTPAPAPAPVVADAPTAVRAVPAGELTLAVAKGLMRPIYEAAKARSVPLGALVGASDIIEVDDSAIVFGFRHAAHVTVASTERNLDMLKAVVAEVFGRPLSVRCTHDAGIEDWMQRERASRSPLVRAAQEMGARIVSAEPEDEP